MIILRYNMNMRSTQNKKVFIVHCWDGKIEDGWYPWLKKLLEEKGVSVVMENMPNTEAPVIKDWTSKLDNQSVL